MELENINENTIKIKMTFDDLRERGINLSEFLTNQDAVEELFYDISSELDITEQFLESDVVSFQVRPNSKGIDLMVRGEKVNMDEIDFPSDPEEFTKAIENMIKNRTEAGDNPEFPEISQAAEMLFENNRSQKKEEDLDEENLPEFTYFTLKFRNLDDAIDMAKTINQEVEESELYKYADKYYMTILQNQKLKGRDFVKGVYAQMLEFGQDEKTPRETLIEYGKSIFEYDALELLRQM
ncbi:adaptor protein MecA [Streptococcaceae bacterium ESL0687]|nr:adaptor protein MecA [Streptococcaceae bacterium ESL0687]